MVERLKYLIESVRHSFSRFLKRTGNGFRTFFLSFLCAPIVWNHLFEALLVVIADWAECECQFVGHHVSVAFGWLASSVEEVEVLVDDLGIWDALIGCRMQDAGCRIFQFKVPCSMFKALNCKLYLINCAGMWCRIKQVNSYQIEDSS